MNPLSNLRNLSITSSKEHGSFCNIVKYALIVRVKAVAHLVLGALSLTLAIVTLGYTARRTVFSRSPSFDTFPQAIKAHFIAVGILLACVVTTALSVVLPELIMKKLKLEQEIFKASVSVQIDYISEKTMNFYIEDWNKFLAGYDIKIKGSLKDFKDVLRKNSKEIYRTVIDPQVYIFELLQNSLAVLSRADFDKLFAKVRSIKGEPNHKEQVLTNFIVEHPFNRKPSKPPAKRPPPPPARNKPPQASGPQVPPANQHVSDAVIALQMELDDVAEAAAAAEAAEIANRAAAEEIANLAAAEEIELRDLQARADLEYAEQLQNGPPPELVNVVRMLFQQVPDYDFPDQIFQEQDLPEEQMAAISAQRNAVKPMKKQVFAAHYGKYIVEAEKLLQKADQIWNKDNAQGWHTAAGKEKIEAFDAAWLLAIPQMAIYLMIQADLDAEKRGRKGFGFDASESVITVDGNNVGLQALCLSIKAKIKELSKDESNINFLKRKMSGCEAEGVIEEIEKAYKDSGDSEDGKTLELINKVFTEIVGLGKDLPTYFWNGDINKRELV